MSHRRPTNADARRSQRRDARQLLAPLSFRSTRIFAPRVSLCLTIVCVGVLSPPDAQGRAATPADTPSRRAADVESDAKSERIGVLRSCVHSANPAFPCSNPASEGKGDGAAADPAPQQNHCNTSTALHRA